MRTLISGGLIVNEGCQMQGNIIIDDDQIKEITATTETPRGNFDTIVDATGCCVMPGIIDSHVHFREPGLTYKADINRESRSRLWRSDDIL